MPDRCQCHRRALWQILFIRGENMALGDEDHEYLRQLAWIYPSDYVAELRRLAEAVVKEQLSRGERQNIREIVWGIMDKIRAETDGVTPADTDAAAEIAAEAGQEGREKVLAALTAGQPHILSGMGPEVVVPLSEALAGVDAAVAANAGLALRQLTDNSAIDAFCRLWAETRSPELERIMLDAGYLASQPLRLRLLTVLKTGADRVMLAEGPELVPELLAAVDDADRIIAGRARRLLLTLTNRRAIDAVCETVLAEPDNERLRAWAVAAGYAPANDSRAALFYVITGQWDKYYALDWQETRPLLSKGYNAATAAERQQFLAAARKSGHSLLLAGLLPEGGNRAEYEEITGEDWAAMVDFLVSRERWTELYRLAFKAPPAWAAEIALTLVGADWQPPAWERPGWETIAANCPQTAKTVFVPDGRELINLDLSGLGAAIACAAFHPNQRIVAGGGSDGRLRLWHVASGSLWRTVDLHADAITALAFTPDGRQLVTAGREGKVHVWQLPDVTWVKSVSGQPGLVTAMAGSNSGRILAAAGAGSAAAVRIWAWDGAYMTNQGQYPGSLFSAADVNLEHKLAAGGSRDGKIRLYAFGGSRSGNKVWAAHAGPIKALAFSGHGRLLVSAGTDAQLKVWEVDSGRLLWAMPETGSLLAVSHDAAMAAVVNPNQNVLAIRQLRMAKPMALATPADWRHAAQLAALPQLETEIRQQARFLHALLAAKFRYDIML
ncbi:WD40 repeat domain-containing protein [Sporomusa carbonis]|uniref:WD40 repeat domain-containing protein n=1 Tax=Sporomusa carbonis TaxID=3076075 RepID=UPI003C7EACB1